MESRNERIVEQKSKLAEKVLKVAEQALGDIEAIMGECSPRDLINIFNSSIKVHRDLLSDIVSIQETESKQEKEQKNVEGGQRQRSGDELCQQQPRRCCRCGAPQAR